MNQETYISLLIEYKSVIAKLDDYGRREFGRDYFGQDICRKSFLTSIKGDYPAWLKELFAGETYKEHYFIIRETETGGASGGNCYDDSEAEAWRKDDDRDDETDNVDHKKSKKLLGYNLADLPQYEFEERITEYYGNYTDIEYRFVLMYDLLYPFSRQSKIDRVLPTLN